eukprot:244703-Rhodomonas_salina.2
MPRWMKNVLYSRQVPVKKGQWSDHTCPGRLLVSASDVVGPRTLDEYHHSIFHQVPHVVPRRVDMAGKLAIDWVVGYLDAHCIVLPDIHRQPLLVSKAA